MLPPFLFGGTAQTPQLLNEMSGLYRPVATNADLDRLYATSVDCYSASRVWIDNIGAVQWYLLDPNGSRVDPATDWLARLLASRSMSETMKRTEISIRFRGHSLTWKRRFMVGGQIFRLRWINFNLYQPDRSSDGLRGFRVYANTNVTEPMRNLGQEVNYIDIRDAIYMHEIDLHDDFDGVSSAEVAFAAAGLDVESLTSALAFFQNAAIGALLVQPAADQPVQPSDKEVKNFGDLLRRVAKGVLNTGRNVITPNRWDVQNLQEHFADLQLKDLRDIADDATFRAFDVPLEMVKAAAANYAEAYVVIHNWVQNRFIPRCHWYGDGLTEQLANEYQEYRGYSIVPNFDKVPAQKDDLARRVEIANAKLAGGYIDLYTAAQATDETPDPALKGLYKVGNTVVPLSQLATIWQRQTQSSSPFGGSSAGGGSSMPSGGGLTPMKLPRESATATAGLSGKYQALGYDAPLPIAPPAAIKSIAVNSVTSDVWLPDEQYKELKNWRLIVDRKGRDYPFAAKSLPCDSVEFGKSLLAHGFELDEAFTAIKAHAVVAAKATDPKAATNPAYVSLQLADESVKTIAPVYSLLKSIKTKPGSPNDGPLHVTLAFAPDVDSQTLAKVSKSLPDSMDLNVKAIGLHSFDDNGDGYPVHLVIDKSPELLALQKQIYDAFTANGVELSPYSRPDQYNPHVTLAYASEQPALPMLPKELDLPIKALQIGRDDYQTIHEVQAAKSITSAVPTYATPEEYQRFWDRYDKLKDEIRRDWLTGYMKKVGPEIVDHYSKLAHDMSADEVLNILAKHHADLTQEWIGTADQPGPLLAVTLAGFAAGNDTLDTGATAKPVSSTPIAAKAFSLPVDFDLLNQEAFDFVQKYAFNLIKGIDQTTADNVRDAVADGQMGGLSKGQIAKSILSVFNDQDRAQLIAQTESNNAFVEGALNRWTNAGVTQARWRTVDDPSICDVCKRLDGQVADIAKGWTDPETGIVYRTSAHPGDRCFRQPVL